MSYNEPIRIKRGADGTWMVLLPDVGEWLPSPFFGPARYDEVERAVADRNPGYRIERI